MKNKYVTKANRLWLVGMWLMSVALFAQAQTVQPPVIQWQRVMGFDTYHQRVRVAKASNGGYAILSGLELIRLSADGDVNWRTKVTGVYLAGAKRYAEVGTLPSLVATSDGGFAILVNDEYYSSIAKFDSDGKLTWQNVLVYRGDFFNKVEMNTYYESLITTPDRGYLVAGNVAPGNTRYVVVNKLSDAGNKVWNSIVSYGDADFPPATFVSKVINSPDGGYLLVGTTKIGGLAAKLNSEGRVIAKEAYDYLSSINDVIPAPNGSEGYIVVGINKNGTGTSTVLINPKSGTDTISGTHRLGEALSARNIVDDGAGHYTVLGQTVQNVGDFRLTNYTHQNEIRWTKTLGGSGADVPQDFITTDDGGYVVVGITTSTDGDVQGKSTNSPAAWIVKLASGVPTNALTINQPTYNCQTAAITFNTSGGDGSTITYNAPGISRASLTSNTGTVEQGLRNDPKPITITATQNGQTVSYTFDFGAFCGGTQPPAAGPLTLLAPTYDCTTGAFRFNASGGDGSPIEYYAAPGITDWTTNPNQFVDQESRTATDVQPFTLMARQNGVTVSYVWNLRAVCPNPPADNPLALLAPTYDCATGAITFNTSGGNGTLIEYRAAPGITDWTTNPNQFVDQDSRTASDVKPFTLMARQSGVLVSYVWDLKAACGRARVGVGEQTSELSVSVLGNPIGEALTVEVQGAENKFLSLRLVDGRGRLVESRSVEQAGALERQRFNVQQSGPGLLLLRVSSGSQAKTIKIMKQ